MLQVKNLSNGEIMSVSNVSVKDGKIMGRYEFGTRFYNKYGHMLQRVGADGECPILELKDGFEVVPNSKADKRIEVEQPAPQPAIDEQPKAQPEVAVERPQPAAMAQPTMPTMDAAAQAFAALTPLFSGVQANVLNSVMAELKPMLDNLQALMSRAPQVVTHVIKIGDKETKFEAGEVFHENFDDILKRTADGEWIYLYGPTGSGKNVMGEQIAKALDLPFHYQAHTTDRFELTGFVDANGTYHETEFYRAYTGGGFFFLDELDASDINALITLNSAANGYFAFPNGTVKQHPNFRCMAAGNTCGRGATDDYTGRQVLDISSMGRFKPRFHDYSDTIDFHDANGDEELVRFIHAMREAKKKTGAQIIASPRQIKGIVRDIRLGIKLTDSLRDIFATYMTADELNIVKKFISDRDDMDGNKYAQAFSKVKAVEY